MMNYFMTEVLKIKLFLRAPLQLEGKTASPTGITLVLSPVPPLKFSLKPHCFPLERNRGVHEHQTSKLGT